MTCGGPSDQLRNIGGAVSTRSKHVRYGDDQAGAAGDTGVKALLDRRLGELHMSVSDER